MKDFLVVLASMVLVVPIAKRLGLGSVLGYLIAGVLIGPSGLGLLGQTEQAAHLAEFGVIMMLLLIGLELNPKLLWKLRGPIFGLGSLQVLGTAALFFLLSLGLGLPWQSAVAIGLIVSSSSTAVVLPTLQERGYAKSVGGERAFSVLLFQDMAVIPVLAILPLLPKIVRIELPPEGNVHAAGALQNQGPAVKALLILGAVVAVVATGRLALRPLFALIGRLKIRETFTALALLIVMASAALMSWVGLSPALGAFLAGVVLADSEYRHQIEADIEPFKGLLLGLFFITVGAGIPIDLIQTYPLTVLGWVAAIVIGKGILLYALARMVRTPAPESLLFAASLAQGGEFAFVIIGQTSGLLLPSQAQVLTTSIAVSMALAPLLIQLTIRYGMSRLDCQTPQEARKPDHIDAVERENPVLVIGIGRFGQTLTRFMNANGIKCTVLDIDSEQIELTARFQMKAYFGDGSNMDLLKAAGIEHARALVIAIDEPETTLRIVEEVKKSYPRLKIFSRSYDRVHAYKLIHHGVDQVAIETSGSAIFLGTEVLKSLGLASARVFRKAQIFQKKNQQSILDLAKRFHEDDRESFINTTREYAQQLEAMLLSDQTQMQDQTDHGWEPAPRG
ncbi:MAG: cation:proton antiporter [Bdellovibrionales bacterium]|nr:cation:proton antiporter [Bdellovibrionales bacterium]